MIPEVGFERADELVRLQSYTAASMLSGAHPQRIPRQRITNTAQRAEMKGVEGIWDHYWVLRQGLVVGKRDRRLPFDAFILPNYIAILLIRIRFSVKDADVVRFPLDVVSSHTRPHANVLGAPQ